MVDHFSLLLLHALLISVFFGFLWKRGARERLRYVVKVFGLLAVGAIVVGWIMVAV